MNTSKQTESMLLIMWTIALVGVLGSLFYSEILDYEPCKLCWIQRILLYPLVVIYGVALMKKNIEIALPGLILTGIGMLVSIYHYLLQKVPALQKTGDICGDVPCDIEYVNYFGFMTIPFLAGVAFIIIFSMHISMLRR